MDKNKVLAIITAGALSISLMACSSQQSSQVSEAPVSSEESTVSVQEDNTAEIISKEESYDLIAAEDITVNETLNNSADGEHAIEADGSDISYSNISVIKSGDSSGDEADFYGENAAIFATNGATLTLDEIVVSTNGTHANGVFSYGEGTTVNISNSVITTDGNCSGGLMTTGGGTMNATNLNIHTTGNSSAAIRSDRGGGTVTVTGGSYITDGKGSPAIYSTADITVNEAYLESTSAQGVVVEGRNSVTLNDVELVADNNSKNSDKSDYYQAVMIYQSMSGDAAEGLASFEMNEGSLLNKNGDVFFVNNTSADISLTDVDITNEGDGVFLRAEAAGWGQEGSNGGHVNLTATDQTIDGDIIVDSVSELNLYLNGSSEFSGSINPDGEAGSVYVEIEEGSVWNLTGDSYITSLTAKASSINLNGYKLYINGTEYNGEDSTGEAITFTVSTSSNGGAPSGFDGTKPDGEPPERPDGENGGAPSGFDGTKPDREPPERPDGENGGTPPEKPRN